MPTNAVVDNSSLDLDDDSFADARAFSTIPSLQTFKMLASVAISDPTQENDPWTMLYNAANPPIQHCAFGNESLFV